MELEAHNEEGYSQIEECGRFTVKASKRFVGKLIHGGCSATVAIIVMNTYDRDDECNPHEEIESPKNVVENLFPILISWGGDEVLAIFGTALDCSSVEAKS